MTTVWDSSYTVGYRHIDMQRQKLFDRFNALIDACRQQKGREKIVLLFKFLDTYVEEHSAAEQSLLEANETLLHWLIRHIRTVDGHLGTFLNRSRA